MIYLWVFGNCAVFADFSGGPELIGVFYFLFFFYQGLSSRIGNVSIGLRVLCLLLNWIVLLKNFRIWL